MDEQSLEVIEREFLLSTLPSEVLKYLQEKSKNVPDSSTGGWLQNELLPETATKALLEKNNRVIDLGLSLISHHPDVIESILTRHTKDSTVDSSILTAVLSNRLALSIFTPEWLSSRLEWIATKGSYENIVTLFSNTSLPGQVISDALQKKNWCLNVSEERYLEILRYLLQNPRVLAEPEEDHDYDMSQNSIISDYWYLLLTLPVNDKTARVLAFSIENFLELHIPYEFSKTLGLGEDIGFKEKGIQAHKAFLELVFSRWVRKPSEEEDIDYSWIHYKTIKVNVVKKIPTYYIRELEEYLLRKNDPTITENYFSRAFFIEIEKFDTYLKEYGRIFLLGLAHNNLLFLKRNKEIRSYFWKALQFNDIEKYPAPKDFPDLGDIRNICRYRCKELSKRKDGEEWEDYVSNLDDDDEDTPLNNTNDLNNRLDKIEEKIKNSRSSDSSSINQQIKNLSEQISILSKKIDAVGYSSEWIISSISRRLSSNKMSDVLIRWTFVLIFGYVIVKIID